MLAVRESPVGADRDVGPIYKEKNKVLLKAITTISRQTISLDKVTDTKRQRWLLCGSQCTSQHCKTTSN